MSASLFDHMLLIILFLIPITTSQITESIESLTTELKSLFCNDLLVGGDKCMNGTKNGNYGIQDFVNSLSGYFENDIKDITDITTTIINNLDDTLNIRASFLTTMASQIEQSCIQYAQATSGEFLPDFDSLNFAGNTDRQPNLPTDIAYSSVYGDDVSLGYTTYKLPNDVDYNDENVQIDAQISQLLDATMLDLHDEHCVDNNGNEMYCNMYFGTANGVFRQYPGGENSKSNGVYKSYDPRYRPWYVSAATARKDVIIIIDQSGSMQENNRMTIAKEAVISVLNTLGQASFVSVVAFNDEVTLSCFGEDLVSATSRNVAKLISFVESLTPIKGTKFEKAFDAAFSILEQGPKSCQTSILFLTDGKSDDPSDLISKRNTVDINAVIFSYTLGGEADTAIPKKVATLTNGIYKHIEDQSANLASTMSSFYLYYAYGRHQENNFAISSPYLDFDTGIAMITMAMPVYFDVTHFVGVVGTDIPLSFLSDAMGDIVIGRKSYSFVVNEQSEAILHPLIPDPLTTLFSEGDEYNAVYIQALEPTEFDTTLLTDRENGMVKITANIKQAAGDVSYNGYIHETADLLYIYSGVGPTSLSLGIVIFTEDGISAPNIKGFGFKSSPSTLCVNTSLPSDCLAPFNLLDNLEKVITCQSSWINEAGIEESTYAWSDSYISVDYPAWFLQAGAWSNSIDFINKEPTCVQIESLHKLTNRLPYDQTKIPYNGFRSEISGKILNSIYTMTSLGEFWKKTYLEPNSKYFGLYFGSYQGLSITYPASKYNREYNCLLRPWYQRATSYPDLLVFTTPYSDSTTGLLVASGATTINAPGTQFPFGVAAFDYEFDVFLSFFDNAMNNVCDVSSGKYCYLIDTSGFLLYYNGIADAMNDNDISIKFFGDFEPTLFQSLIDLGFFVNNTNVNYLGNTIDISWSIDNGIYVTANPPLDSTGRTFVYNSGTYTVHKIQDTNLYVVYIINYVSTNTGLNCPNNAACADVHSPGCMKKSNGECKIGIIDACIKPDTPTISTIDKGCSTSIDNKGICVLKTDEHSDVCASNFNVDDCGPGADHSFSLSVLLSFLVTVSASIFSLFA